MQKIRLTASKLTNLPNEALECDILSPFNVKKRQKLKKWWNQSSCWSKTSLHTKNQVSTSKTGNFDIFELSNEVKKVHFETKCKKSIHKVVITFDFMPACKKSYWLLHSKQMCLLRLWNGICRLILRAKRAKIEKVRRTIFMFTPKIRYSMDRQCCPKGNPPGNPPGGFQVKIRKPPGGFPGQNQETPHLLTNWPGGGFPGFWPGNPPPQFRLMTQWSKT